MTTEEMVIIAAIGILIPPAIILMTRKKSTSKGGVVVTCPGCQTDLKIGRLRNYKCPKCNEEVFFFDPKTRKPLLDVETVKCTECNQHQPKGVKFCIKCKEPLGGTGASGDVHV